MVLGAWVMIWRTDVSREKWKKAGCQCLLAFFHVTMLSTTCPAFLPTLRNVTSDCRSMYASTSCCSSRGSLSSAPRPVLGFPLVVLWRP